MNNGNLNIGRAAAAAPIVPRIGSHGGLVDDLRALRIVSGGRVRDPRLDAFLDKFTTDPFGASFLYPDVLPAYGYEKHKFRDPHLQHIAELYDQEVLAWMARPKREASFNTICGNVLRNTAAAIQWDDFYVTTPPPAAPPMPTRLLDELNRITMMPVDLMLGNPRYGIDPAAQGAERTGIAAIQSENERIAAWVKRRAEEAKAKRKALDLLQSVVSEAEWEQWCNCDRIKLVSKNGWTYVFTEDARTWLKDPDGRTGHACIQLSEYSAPQADRIVAEYLLIKNNELKYLATANITWEY